MTDDLAPEPIPDAVRRLYDLVVDYERRSEAAETELIRAFEAAASAVAPAVGELTLEDDDDERLVLTASGRFSGQVLVSDPAPHWEPVARPEDIVDHYDPVDLFSDLAEVIAEAFPGVESETTSEPGGAGADSTPPSVEEEPEMVRSATPATAFDGPWAGHVPESRPTADASSTSETSAETRLTPEAAEAATPPPGTAMLHVLEDLHSAGALTDAQFEAQKAKLGK